MSSSAANPSPALSSVHPLAMTASRVPDDSPLAVTARKVDATIQAKAIPELNFFFTTVKGETVSYKLTVEKRKEIQSLALLVKKEILKEFFPNIPEETVIVEELDIKNCTYKFTIEGKTYEGTFSSSQAIALIGKIQEIFTETFSTRFHVGSLEGSGTPFFPQSIATKFALEDKKASLENTPFDRHQGLVQQQIDLAKKAPEAKKAQNETEAKKSMRRYLVAREAHQLLKKKVHACTVGDERQKEEQNRLEADLEQLNFHSMTFALMDRTSEVSRVEEREKEQEELTTAKESFIRPGLSPEESEKRQQQYLQAVKIRHAMRELLAMSTKLSTEDIKTYSARTAQLVVSDRAVADAFREQSQVPKIERVLEMEFVQYVERVAEGDFEIRQGDFPCLFKRLPQMFAEKDGSSPMNELATELQEKMKAWQPSQAIPTSTVAVPILGSTVPSAGSGAGLGGSEPPSRSSTPALPLPPPPITAPSTTAPVPQTFESCFSMKNGLAAWIKADT